MSADLPPLIRKGLSDWCDEDGLPADGAAPPVRPMPARDRSRRPWFAPVATAAAVVLVVAAMMLVPHWLGRKQPAPSVPAAPLPPEPTSAVIPRVFAGSSLTAASVQDAPIGPAVALVGYPDVAVLGDIGGGQALAVSVDGHRYRKLTNSVPSAGYSLLSPDGGHAVVAGNGTLRLVDLRTGSTRSYHAGGSGAVTPYSYAPDGRSVVYSLAAKRDNACPCRAILIDLATGHRTTLSEASERGAAFSPDGKQVAIQVHGQIIVTDTAGHELKRLESGGAQLTSGHAWSPDGRFLALTVEDAGVVTGLKFVSVAPGYATPTALTSESVGILGWIDPQHLVTYDFRPNDAVVVHELAAGTQQVLSTVGDGMVNDMATDFLPRLVTVDAGPPDYGPRPAWVGRAIGAAIATSAVLVAGVIVALVLILRRRRRRKQSASA